MSSLLWLICFRRWSNIIDGVVNSHFRVSVIVVSLFLNQVLLIFFFLLLSHSVFFMAFLCNYSIYSRLLAHIDRSISITSMLRINSRTIKSRRALHLNSFQFLFHFFQLLHKTSLFKNAMCYHQITLSFLFISTNYKQCSNNLQCFSKLTRIVSINLFFQLFNFKKFPQSILKLFSV